MAMEQYKGTDNDLGMEADTQRVIWAAEEVVAHAAIKVAAQELLVRRAKTGLAIDGTPEKSPGELQLRSSSNLQALPDIGKVIFKRRPFPPTVLPHVLSNN